MDAALKYLAIFFGSMFKFVAGPIIGGANEFHFLITALFTALGMMASVIIFSFIGEKVKEYWHNRRLRKNKKIVPKRRHRRILQIWNKFGIVGLSLITPVLLTPIGGTLIAVTLGVPKPKIILHMSYSAVIWSVIISLAIVLLNNGVHSLMAP